MSEAFSDAIKRVVPDAIEPDKESQNGKLGKAPDFYFPRQRIAVELKSVSINLNSGEAIGRRLQRAKKEDLVIFGTVKIDLSYSEFLKFSDKMSGKLRQRISHAEKQLASYSVDETVLTVCCVFIEIDRSETLQWDARRHPSRQMVRSICDAELRKSKIDCLVTFVLNEQREYSVDIIQTVFENNHLQAEFDQLLCVLRQAALHLPFLEDRSVLPLAFFMPVDEGQW